MLAELNNYQDCFIIGLFQRMIGHVSIVVFVIHVCCICLLLIYVYYSVYSCLFVCLLYLFIHVYYSLNVHACRTEQLSRLFHNRSLSTNDWACKCCCICYSCLLYLFIHCFIHVWLLFYSCLLVYSCLFVFLKYSNFGSRN